MGDSSIIPLNSNLRVGMQREVYEAAESGSVEALRWHNNWKHQKTAGGNNVLHIHLRKPTQIIPRGVRVVTDNINMSFIRYVIGDSALLQSNDQWDTPLHLAARFGHTGVVQEFLTLSELVRLGLLNKANNRKDTALHDAARATHAGIVMLLVEAGAGENEDAPHHMPNNLGETPLFLAAERGCFESFDAIAGHTRLAVLERKGPCGQTALHIAVLNMNKDIVARILEKNTSSLLIRVKNDEGQTPLHCCAAQDGKSERSILRALINQDDEYNSAAYIQDNEGRTLVHVATLNLNINGARMLARSHPDCIEIVDNNGRNVVHYAANLGLFLSFSELLRKVPQCEMLINEKDNDGNTPLHLLVATTRTLPFYYFVEKLPLFLQRHKNVDVMAFNDKNLTAHDLISSNDNFRRHIKLRRSIKLLPRSRRIPIPGRTDDTQSTKTVDNVKDNKCISSKVTREERISHLQKVGETRLVVAALIVTVSFTAGFTPPGGFDQSPGETIGLAVLAKKASFIVFLVSDAIAFTMSSVAIICYFALASQVTLSGAQALSI